MAVMHVEDNPTTRHVLAELVGVGDDFRVEGCEWIPTDDTAKAEKRLRQGAIQVLILDLMLDEWSLNPKNMNRVLARLIKEQQPLDPQDEQNFQAYRLALLAHDQKVPCALLTNYADLLNPEKGLTLEGLRQAFHAEKVFRKDDYSECAAWVKEKMSIGT
jgi:CheY-like chemotaxis protein